MLHVVAEQLRLGDGAHLFFPVDFGRRARVGESAKRAGFPIRLSERSWNNGVESDYERHNYTGDCLESMTVHSDPPELKGKYIYPASVGSNGIAINR
jgi:hypothetical protein